MAVELQDEFVAEKFLTLSRLPSVDRIRFKLFRTVQNAATELDNFLNTMNTSAHFMPTAVDDFNRNTQKSEDSPRLSIEIKNSTGKYTVKLVLNIVRGFTPPDQFIKPLLNN